jgi:triosephosphate isomerase
MGETNETVNKKIVAALATKLCVIFCIGEQTRNRDGEHFDFIKEQLRVGLRDVPVAKLSKITIAYEPVWAIGATTAMSPRDMHEMAIFIRKTIVELYGQPGMSTKILYGGSIDETNAGEMLRDGDVDGLLVGRVSTDATKFALLLSVVEKV